MCSEQNLPTLYVTKVRYVRIQICIPITYKRLSGMGDSSSCESVEKKTFQASLHLLNSWNFEKFFTTLWILWITKFWVTRFGSKSTSCRTTAKVSINPCHPWRGRNAAGFVRLLFESVICVCISLSLVLAGSFPHWLQNYPLIDAFGPSLKIYRLKLNCRFVNESLARQFLNLDNFIKHWR